MNSILYEKEITVNAIDSAYEKGKKEGTIEELEQIKAKMEDNLWYSLGDKGYVFKVLDEHISKLKEQ